jgi:hypothetical protein
MPRLPNGNPKENTAMEKEVKDALDRLQFQQREQKQQIELLTKRVEDLEGEARNAIGSVGYVPAK